MPNPERPQRHFAFVSLLEYGKWGASEYLWSQTALELSKQTHRITACTHGWEKPLTSLNPLRTHGVTMIERVSHRGGRMRDFLSGIKDPESLPLMHAHAVKQLVRLQPDMVLLSTPWITGSHLTGWTKQLNRHGIKYAILVHTHAGHVWPVGKTAEVLSSALNRAAAVYCVSQDNQHLLERQLQLRPGLISVVRNPLAIEHHIPAPKWPIGETSHIACVGRLDPAQKGQDIILDCLSAKKWHQRDCTFSFFGDGPGRQQLEYLAETFPQNKITFHGHTSTPADIWKTHHILAFPSRYEGLGLAVAEAQLCGRPVVISDCAARELVIDGKTGFIATGTSVSSFGDALERAWATRDRWSDMGNHARRHMQEILPAEPAKKFAKLLTQIATIS